MISYLKGNVIHTGTNAVTVDVLGVGYKIFVPTHVMAHMSEEVSLWIHTAVRENALELYGFFDRKELEFFELLLTISGIGPKSALGIMSVAPVDVLISAVASGNTSYLTKVSGIGAKSAQKIVLELKDKIKTIVSSDEVQEIRKEETDALDALTALGYSVLQAREALKHAQNAQTTNEKIREALKILGS